MATKPIPLPVLADRLIGRMKSHGTTQTAKDFDVCISALQRVTIYDNPPSARLLKAMGYRAVYKHGRGPALGLEDFRAHVGQLVRQCGGYKPASEAHGISGAQLHRFVTGTRTPEPRILEALGFEIVYLPCR